MVTRSVQIINPTGLHARPAAAFIKEVKKYPCKTSITYHDETISAKSIIALMSAGIECGSTIELHCDGEQENEALEALCAAIASGLGE